MDALSNILFVKEALPALSELAARLAGLDKFRPEAALVAANYHSARVRGREE
jgi:hypothetical protein